MAVASLARSLRPYVWYARLAFQRRAAYRLANFTGIAVNFFFFLVHAQVYLAFFGERRLMAGWEPSEAVLYFAASEALLMVLAAFPDWVHNLPVRIRSGDVACDLARPVSLLGRELGERFGTSLYYLLTRAAVLYGGALLVYSAAPPLRVELLCLPLTLALGIGVAGSLWYVAGATAFWTQSALGPMNALLFAHTVLGGVVVPLDFYPPALRLACDLLPFRAALYTPVALLTGKLAGPALAFGIAHQLLWLALLVATARALEARGLRRLAVQGG